MQFVRRRGERMKPIVFWLTGTLALLALLIVRGGFARPLLPYAVGVLAAGLLAGFMIARKRRKP